MRFLNTRFILFSYIFIIVTFFQSDVKEVLKELDSTEYRERFTTHIAAHPVTRRIRNGKHQENDCAVEIKLQG